jgi:D-sedoheptulose 7-phosphate isomerase
VTDGSDTGRRQSAAADLLALAELATRVARELAGEIEGVARLAAGALAGGGKLMFCGNGGSAADAQHLATEYVVRFQRDRNPMAAIALTTDTSLLTAAANDYGFEHVFARQVRALGQPGDVLFLHSTSGRSPNLLRAAEAARERGIVTVALLAGGGGDLAAVVDHALVLPTDRGARAQELQLAIGHTVCRLVEEHLNADD